MSDLLCVNESTKPADQSETKTSGDSSSPTFAGSSGYAADLGSGEIRSYENESLGTIAMKIVEHANKADDHVIEAAMIIIHRYDDAVFSVPKHTPRNSGKRRRICRSRNYRAVNVNRCCVGGAMKNQACCDNCTFPNWTEFEIFHL